MHASVRDLRAANAIPSTASQLASAIAAFAKEYLPEAERTSKSDGRKPKKETSLTVPNAGSDSALIRETTGHAKLLAEFIDELIAA